MDANILSATAPEQGARIRLLRIQTGLSRRAFALKHGIPVGSMQNWEEDRYQGLSQKAINTLLKAFSIEGVNCTPEYLLYGVKTENTSNELNALAESNHAVHQNQNSSLIDKATHAAKQRKINERLINAIRAGQEEKVIKLLADNPIIRQEPTEYKVYDESQDTLLHKAVKKGRLNIVEILVEGGAQVDLKNKFKQTPLHLAVKYAYGEIVNYLILNGANVNSPDYEGDTPLAWACRSDQTAIAAQLIKSGAQINTKNTQGMLPIHWAALNGHSSIIKLLLEHNAKTMEKNLSGETPIICAVKNGHIDAIKLLEKNNL